MGGLPPHSDASRSVIAPILGDDALAHAGKALPRGETSCVASSMPPNVFLLGCRPPPAPLPF
eukprot:8702859-Pyramimonas_sp.AAC.1